MQIFVLTLTTIVLSRIVELYTHCSNSIIRVLCAFNLKTAYRIPQAQTQHLLHLRHHHHRRRHHYFLSTHLHKLSACTKRQTFRCVEHIYRYTYFSPTRFCYITHFSQCNATAIVFFLQFKYLYNPSTTIIINQKCCAFDT